MSTKGKMAEIKIIELRFLAVVGVLGTTFLRYNC
jgi:hypothetical protein